MKYFLSCFLLFTFLFAGCKKEDSTIPFENIFIIGNSITYHAPNSGIDWHGSWGMAASVADSDYVHILTKRFRRESPNAQIQAVNLSAFENHYWVYDINRLDTMLSGSPDLVILRIGENIPDNMLDQYSLSDSYLKLINYLRSRNREVKVICASGFWKDQRVEEIIKEAAGQSDCSYIQLSDLDKGEYKAWGLFSDQGVAEHPGNAGMKAIADRLWTEVERLQRKE